MKSPLRSIAAGLCAFALSAAAASADPFPALPVAQTVSDGALAQVRGMYVPPAPPAQAPHARTYRDALAAGPGLLPQAAARGVQAVQRSPLDGLGGEHGTVTYFGVTMLSSWSQSGTGGVRGDSVGLSIGISTGDDGIVISTGSTAQNGGLSNAPGSGTISGSATNNFSGGVGQNIQVAGDGNAISNTAAVTVNPSQDAIIIPTADTCGSQCTISYGLNGLQIGIKTPQGTVLQSIGPSGVLQSAQIESDMNTVRNQLGVTVKVTAPTFGAGSILPILQTLQGLP